MQQDAVGMVQGEELDVVVEEFVVFFVLLERIE